TDITTAALVGEVEEAGSIYIQTEDLFLDAASLATSVEPGAGATGGEIEILASGKVELRNAAFIDTATFSSGDAGDVKIHAQTIALDNSSNIFSTTSAAGNAGDVTLTAANAISLTNRSNLSTAVDTGATGEGGQVSLTAESLTITGGSQVQALTRGNGNSGKVILDIAEGIIISGIAEGFASGVFTATQAANSGTGGNIEVATGNLLIAEGAVLSAQTASTNDGGNIDIMADIVELRNGGQLLTNAFSSGNAGDIHLDASQQVLITGTNTNPGTAPPPVPRASVTTRNQGSPGEVEPNDSLAEAMVLSDNLFSLSTADAAIPDISLSDRLPYVSLAATGSDPATSDYYSFEVVAGTRGFFDIDNGVNGDDPGDPGNVPSRISLFDSDGNLLTFSRGRASILQGAGGSTDTDDPYLQFTFRESGTYFLKVTRDVDIDEVIDDTPDARIPAPSTYTLQVSLGNPNFAGNVVNTINDSTNNDSGLFAQTEGAGTAGDITINTLQLTIEDQGIIRATTAATGSAGTISIEAADSVVLNQGNISTAVETGAILPHTAVASNIEIDTEELNLTNDSNISTATAGIGDAGEVEINASDRLSIDNSTISSAVNPTGVGTGGRINLQALTVEITNGARVSTATEGQGTAGMIDITANRFLATNGGQLLSTTSSGSNAGNIELTVTDDITLTGAGTGLFANSTPGSTGDGGSIIIDPTTMTIEDGAGIAVDSQGAGIGGEILINAGSLSLHRGFITAEAFSDKGGDITLDIADILMLLNQSLISATAGIGSGAGDGGNINIAAQFVIGIPSENSDIIANAFLGDGGRIEITTNAIFGLKFREELTPFSDITASSEFGTDGILIFNRLSVDATQGLNELPGLFVDAASLIGKDACALIDGKIGGGSSLTIIGKGGLPPSPGEPLSNNDALVEWATREPSNQSPAVVVSQQPTDSTGTPIYPEMRQAQGWIINPDGTVILTAEPQRVTLHSPGLSHPGCSY
ncbi:MAG: S-layer family protein, partial [Symploca sp. SIO2G7]|nr:S-layer family protein [Symploca sp. SIO2G7]